MIRYHLVYFAGPATIIKFSVKQAKVEKKLQVALGKLYLLQGQFNDTAPTSTERQLSTSTDTQKKTFKVCSSCREKQVAREEPLLVLSNGATSPFVTKS